MIATSNPRPRGRPTRGEVIERQKSLGDFCRDVRHNKAAMSTHSGATGGYLIPTQLVLGIDEKLRERKLFHKRAYRVPMETKECWIPAFDLVASHATGASPLYGGLNPTWTTPEGSALPESEPTFSGGKLIARDLECYALASNQLVQDGGEALGVYLETRFYQSLAWAVERACLIGDGATEPAGIVTSSATKTVTRAGANAISHADVANMVGALIPACFGNAVWACSITALAKISSLAAYQINPNVSHDDPDLCGTLFTRPLYVTENLPAVGTAGDLCLLDPTLYALGERHIEVAASPHPNFRSNQTVFRLWWRGDGRPLPNGVATLADGSTTAAAFVALGAAA